MKLKTKLTKLTKLETKFATGTLALALSVTTLPALAGDNLAIPGTNLGMHEIIGGSEVQVGDPVQQTTVLIVGEETVAQRQPNGKIQKQKMQFSCSGSIIAKDVILTAAHCLGDDGNAPLVVVFNTNLQNVQRSNVVQVVDRLREEDYDQRSSSQETDQHDIALIKLASPIPAGYQVARFLPASSALQKGEASTLAGYGIDQPIANPKLDQHAGVLRKVDVTVTDPAYGSSEFLVSETNGKGACHGDSGGPAFISQGGQNYLVGVASRLTSNDQVANNGDVGDYSCSVDMVYTNAVSLMSWIRNGVSTLGSSSSSLSLNDPSGSGF